MLELLIGIAVVEMIALIWLSLFAREQVSRRKALRAVPPGPLILKVKGRLTPEATRRLKEMWETVNGTESPITVLDESSELFAHDGTDWISVTN